MEFLQNIFGGINIQTKALLASFAITVVLGFIIIPVLKKYAFPLLEGVQPNEKEYAEVQRMLSFLRFFKTIQDDSTIANNSILREFIGGSVLTK